MADSDQETKTRSKRDAAVKEEISTFNKHVRNINKVTRSIHSISARSYFDPKELQSYSIEYEAILNELSSTYDSICELCFDSPPPKVSEVYERIDIDSCKLLSEVSDRIRESREQDRLNRSQSEEKQSIEKLCSQMVLGRLPSPEPDVFSGDPLKFTSWFNSFKALISTRSIPESERIFYLNKYLSGEAKESVEGFLSLCTPEAYYDALNLLKTRFGSDFIVANAFRQKLRKWPKVSNDDYVGLRKFSDYLSHVETAKSSIRSLSVLDDEQENRSLLFKIPDFCHSRWSRKVAQAVEDGRSYPGFSEFCKFIRIEAEVVNNPITCIRASGGSSHSNQNFRSHSSQGQSFQRRYSHAASSTPLNGQGSFACFYCNGSHLMTHCEGFLSLSLDDKRSFVRTQRLCFGCLRRGHSNRDCQKRMRCSTCNRQHPTILHDDNFQPGAYSSQSGNPRSLCTDSTFSASSAEIHFRCFKTSRPTTIFCTDDA